MDKIYSFASAWFIIAIIIAIPLGKVVMRQALEGGIRKAATTLLITLITSFLFEGMAGYYWLLK